ncbi:MAG: hypothetical protein LUD51_03835 [Clostridia bacterium]|nr:hypothetical protein [Clostridia bacterium]
MNEKTRMKQELNERKRKNAIQEMLSGANEATDAAEKQKELHYNEMLKCAQKKDFKRAKRHANMYMFMDKLSIVSREYAGLIQDQKAISEMFATMQKMNKNFRSFLRLTSAGTTRKAVKNLKKFRKSLSRFDRDMDKMMSAIDSMFDEPKKRGKNAPAPEPDDEASFLKLVGSNQDLADRFAEEPGGEIITGYTAPAGGADPMGGTPGVMPSDDDFISIGRPD